jgi:hypothetical protein
LAFLPFGFRIRRQLRLKNFRCAAAVVLFSVCGGGSARGCSNCGRRF